MAGTERKVSVVNYIFLCFLAHFLAMAST